MSDQSSVSAVVENAVQVIASVTGGCVRWEMFVTFVVDRSAPDDE
ncbi:Uncharacterised protein [Mycobacteroides abscessus subsp. abscessus]|nr:hypothetical protein [Mycobacteroides abscessus]SIH26383.1 Uncharacterised protein [Mycobacteroides abscessus subsp. abscessus]